ncbi:MAG: hypothetical protein HY881_20905 [Deltaproteobacteria bacterium]|nr:hypothetical protein [Deltaproteobacteria bacterium]
MVARPTGPARGILTFGVKLNTDYILGMAEIGKSIKILLDIDLVLCADEITQLEQRTVK